MLIDFKKELVDLEGVTLLDKNKKSATLKGVAIDALMAVYQDEQNLGGEEKLKRYELALMLSKDMFEIKAEEVALIKKLIGKAYGALIVGQAWNILEGK
jgi:uncharacterized protein YhbP (UPF0306 family)